MTTEIKSEYEDESQAYSIIWVSKEDLIDCLPDREEEILQLHDMEVAQLAGKVGDALQESYWIVLSEILDQYLRRKHSEKQNKSAS